VQRVSGGQPHRRANGLPADALSRGVSVPWAGARAALRPSDGRGENNHCDEQEGTHALFWSDALARCNTRRASERPQDAREPFPAVWTSEPSEPAMPRRCEAVRRVKPTAHLLKNSNSPFVGALEELLRLAPPALEPLLIGVPKALQGALLTAEDSALVRCCGGLSGYGCEPEGKQQGHC
jgi:hypothetical protein